MCKNEMEQLGFNYASSILPTGDMPKDITDEEIEAEWTSTRKQPVSVVYVEQQ
jgi:hypothetical protein